jgi:hypothetical protein
VLLLSILASCVIAVDQTVVIDEPVDRIVVHVTAGDLDVEAKPGPVTISGDFGGPGGGPIDHNVVLGELTVTYDCEWCGGSLSIEAPAEVALDLAVGAGDLSVEGMDAELLADVATGSADIRGHGPGPAQISVDFGDLDVWFADPPTRLEGTVKSGSIDAAVPGDVPYAITLDADAGAIHIDGIYQDAASPNVIVLDAIAGSISLEGR